MSYFYPKPGGLSFEERVSAAAKDQRAVIQALGREHMTNICLLHREWCGWDRGESCSCDVITIIHPPTHASR